MDYDMTEGSIIPKLLRFVLPVFLGNVFQQFYNMVDTIIVGRYVSAKALAAVGSTGTIMFLILGFATGLTGGFTVITSQAYGAGDERKVRHSVANGIILSIFVTIVMTAVSLLSMKPLLRLMNTPEDIFQDAYTYISIICVGCAASIFYNLFTSYLRSVGNSQVPLYFLIFSACLNIVLDLAFTVGMRKGVAGAAWATVISQGAAALLTFLYIYMKIPLLRPLKTDWYLDKGESRKQMQVGVPMALQFAITASGTMIMQTSINLFGSTAISAFTAASKVQNLFTQGIVSMGVSMTTYAGQNYGAQKIRRIREGVFKAMLILAAYSVAAAAAEILFLPQFSRLFFAGDVDMAAMLKWEYPYIYVSVAFFIPLCMIFINRNTMQGCGYSLLPMLCGVIELAARFIMAYISMAKHSYALAVAGDAAAWVAAGIFSMFSFFHVIRRIEKKLGEPVRNKEAEIDRHGV